MLTEFKPRVKEILVETLERGIQAVKDGRIGEPADLGILARSFSIALSQIDGFEEHNESFLRDVDMGNSGEFINPELLEFLTEPKGRKTISDSELHEEWKVLQAREASRKEHTLPPV